MFPTHSSRSRPAHSILTGPTAPRTFFWPCLLPVDRTWVEKPRRRICQNANFSASGNSGDWYMLNISLKCPRLFFNTWTPWDLIGIMRDLGVDCPYCHYNQGLHPATWGLQRRWKGLQKAMLVFTTTGRISKLPGTEVGDNSTWFILIFTWSCSNLDLPWCLPLQIRSL